MFVVEKLAEATRKSANLKSELTEAVDNDFNSKHKIAQHKATLLLNKKNKPARKIQELKLAYSEFYLSLILLQNYQNLNFTGFRKILKKHDKVRKFLFWVLNVITFFIALDRGFWSKMAVAARRKFAFSHQQGHRSHYSRNGSNRHE